MIKIGVTGGIGSGKTTVASLLKIIGIPVYIADEESKKLTEKSPVIRRKLIHLFGDSLYTQQGLDKKRLATYIFGDPTYLKQVNAIIHPEVQKHFITWTQAQKSAFCAIESAILFESGFDRIVDVRLMVYAPLEVRIARVLRRENITKEEVLRRINNQMPDEQKQKQSDFTIYNDNQKALLPQLQEFLESLRRMDNAIFPDQTSTI